MLMSLHVTGNLANSVYVQLHAVLPALGCCLKDLRIGNVHPWSKVLSAAQVREGINTSNGHAQKFI